jgi:hypothetical protein
MAGGLQTQGVLEIEFVSGAWTDVSAYVRWGDGVEIDQGRADDTDDAQPGTISVNLDNFSPAFGLYGVFSPDNPLSPFFPNVKEGKRIRFTGGKGATTNSRRITANITSITVNPSSISKISTVTIQASDRLAELGRWLLKSDVVERWLYEGRQYNSDTDIWIFPAEGNAPAQIPNLGRTTSTSNLPQPAVIVQSAGRRGTAAYVDCDGLIMDGALELTPSSSGNGPVALCPVHSTPVQGLFWFSTESGDYFSVLSGRSASGAEIWSFRFYNVSGVGRLDWYVNNAFAAVVDDSPNDGSFHSIWLWQSSGTQTSLYYDAKGIALVTGLFSDTKYVVLGGQMNPFVRGPQKYCLPAKYTGPLLNSLALAGGWEPYAKAGTVSTANIRVSDYMRFTGNVGRSTDTNGGTTRNVMLASSLGRYALEACNEVQRTIGGTVWVRPSDDYVEFLSETGFRQSTVGLTVTAELDEDGTDPPQWQRGAVQNPTRETVSSPGGDATYIDAVQEATPLVRRDGSGIQAVTPDYASSYALAAWATQRGQQTRLRQISVDLTTAATDLWTAVLTTLKPGLMLRYTGVDSSVMGFTYHEGHVMGWKETWTHQSMKLDLYLVPADSPAGFVWDGNDYGRWDLDEDAVIGAISSSATSMTITTAGPPLSQSAGDYPLLLQIGQEYVTVASAPASAVSPQTVTISRGVAPTIAYAHAAGEKVQMAHDVRWSV